MMITTNCAQRRTRTLGCRCAYCTRAGVIGDGERLHVPTALTDGAVVRTISRSIVHDGNLVRAVQRCQAAYDHYCYRISNAWKAPHEHISDGSSEGHL